MIVSHGNAISIIVSSIEMSDIKVRLTRHV